MNRPYPEPPWYKDFTFYKILVTVLLGMGALLIIVFSIGSQERNARQKECSYIMSMAKTPVDSLNLISNVPYCTGTWIQQRRDSAQ